MIISQQRHCRKELVQSAATTTAALALNALSVFVWICGFFCGDLGALFPTLGRTGIGKFWTTQSAISDPTSSSVMLVINNRRSFRSNRSVSLHTFAWVYSFSLKNRYFQRSSEVWIGRCHRSISVQNPRILEANSANKRDKNLLLEDALCAASLHWFKGLAGQSDGQYFVEYSGLLTSPYCRAEALANPALIVSLPQPNHPSQRIQCSCEAPDRTRVRNPQSTLDMLVIIRQLLLEIRMYRGESITAHPLDAAGKAVRLFPSISMIQACN